jgi:hypothetical protein
MSLTAANTTDCASWPGVIFSDRFCLADFSSESQILHSIILRIYYAYSNLRSRIFLNSIYRHFGSRYNISHHCSSPFWLKVVGSGVVLDVLLFWACSPSVTPDCFDMMAASSGQSSELMVISEHTGNVLITESGLLILKCTHDTICICLQCLAASLAQLAPSHDLYASCWYAIFRIRSPPCTSPGSTVEYACGICRAGHCAVSGDGLVWPPRVSAYCEGFGWSCMMRTQTKFFKKNVHLLADPVVVTNAPRAFKVW